MISAKLISVTNKVEEHPWSPFYPEGTRLLILGSFPPPSKRWSIDFYYPNWQNDMWRIIGLIFYDNPCYFEKKELKAFDLDLIKIFLTERKIALSDVARKVIRKQGNASDLFLEIVESIDLAMELRKLPDCSAVVTTGQKSSDVLKVQIKKNNDQPIDLPAIGCYTNFQLDNRLLRWYRMPSSSRAWPRPIAEKAEYYRTMFHSLKIN